LAKLFDLQLARQLDEIGHHLDLQQAAAALNRRGFLTYTGRQWNAASLRVARRHAAAPRPSSYIHTPAFGMLPG
jgi:hypothetical protein